ncbi:MAG TPA: hypothetical protein VLJ83_00650 [Gemmatimonadaceae bacterium]|nr:hypothetical protein [Gemmatimonadaceae bacterium]
MSPLSDTTMQELRGALGEQVKNPDRPMPQVTELLRKVAREARDKGVQPEELLVIFKETWQSISESLRPKSPDQHERIRQNLVTLCIQAYYAE